MAIITQNTQVWFKSAATIIKLVVTSITGLSGAREQIDITTLESMEREYLAGFATPGQVSLGLNYDPALINQVTLRNLYEAGTITTWIIGMSDGAASPSIAAEVITYPTTRTWLDFSGFVSDFPIEFATNDAARSQVTLQRSGPINIREKV